MGEGEDRPRAVGVVSGRRDDGCRGARLGAGDELLAREAALEHQAVQVRVLEREGAVGGAELLERRGLLEALGGLEEGVGDQRGLERLLARAGACRARAP